MKTTLTIEQSARLIELGVDERKASSIYYTTDPCDHKKRIRKYQFRLTDLLCILPKRITDRQRIYELEISVDHYSDAWCVQYTHDTDVNNLEDSFQSAEEMIDAIYAEICFLKENPELVWL